MMLQPSLVADCCKVCFESELEILWVNQAVFTDDWPDLIAAHVCTGNL